MSDQQSKTRLRPVIRVFVSSTFSDMKHERNALAADAFPKLEQLCQWQGFQFQAIDLRWGVSTEAGLDHRTMRICLEELRRAQEISPRPNFLILLGNRYGWRPLPEEISVEEFCTLEHAAAQIPGSAAKSAVAVLREWYREDTNAVPPVYLLQSRRQDLGDDQDYIDDAVWNQVQAVLWTIINRTMPPELLQARFDVAVADGSTPAIVRFQASATEQEIWHGALRVPDAREHVLAFFREIENLAAFSDPKQIKDFVDVDPSGSVEVALQTEEDRLKAELRQRLGSANVFRNEAPARLIVAQDNQDSRTVDVTTDHLAQLCADVVSRLSEIIQGQIEEYWRHTAQASTDRAARELEIEQREYERFAKERGGEESFVGRQVELQAILDYVGSDSRWPLVIHGASGCGKTALVARASQEVAKTRKRIERFIGVAPRSSDLRSLLSSLCQELRQRNPRTDPLPTEIKELCDEFYLHLQTATPEQPLILFLDAFDQLADADNGRLLNWLPPGSLPAHVKLIVSCLSDRATGDPVGRPYAELKRRQIPAESFINLDVLSEAEACLLLFDRWLPKAGRKVSGDQRARIEQRLASPACRQPIFLKLLFEEVQLWHSYDPAPVPGESVPALLGQLFDRLSQPTNHGPLLVDRVLGYLSASRHGLAENEILEILVADPEYRAKLDEATEQTRHELPPNAKRIPIALWSRLRFDLAPYLTERTAPGANVLTFYHRQVAEFVRGYFLDAPLTRLQWHERLAGYFHGQDYFLESLEEQRARAKRLPPTPRPANLRKVDELPCQLLEAAKSSGKWESVEQLFTNLFFLEAKAEAGLVLDLVEDFSQCITSLPVARPKHYVLRLLQAAIRLDLHFIARHPTTLFQCMWNSCWWYDCPAPALHVGGRVMPSTSAPAGGLCALLENWRSLREQIAGASTWICSLRPPYVQLGTSRRAVIRGHLREVADVAFSPDGQRIASASSDETVRIWDAVNGAELAVLVGHDERAVIRGFKCVAFSPDGRLIATGSYDETIRIWDGNSYAQLRVLRGHEDSIASVAFSPDSQRIVSTSSDKTVRVWDAENGTQLLAFYGHKDDVNTANFSPDGKRIASGSGIWVRLQEWDISDDVTGHTWDCTVRLWDPDNGKEHAILQGHDSGICSLAFSPDGNRLVTGSYDKTIRIWDASSGRQLAVLRGHEAAVGALALSHDGRRIVSGAGGWPIEGDSSVRVWDVDNATALAVFEGHEDDVLAVAISPDGRCAASSSSDKTVMLWDLTNEAISEGAQCKHDCKSDAWISQVAFSPDGRRTVTGSSDESVRVWDAGSGEQLAILPGHKLGVRDFAISPDGTRITSAAIHGSGKTFWLWGTETGKRLATMRGHDEWIVSVAFSPDGRLIASGSADYTIRVWDVSSTSKRWFRAPQENKVAAKVLGSRTQQDWFRSIIFSPDSRVIASCGLWVRVFDIETGTELCRLSDPDGELKCIAFSPSGREIATGNGRYMSHMSDDSDPARAYNARVWDVQTGVELCVFEGHEADIRQLAFSSDGKRLVTRSDDECMRVWDVQSGRCLETIQGAGDVYSIAGEPRSSPLRILARALETVIERVHDGKPVAWFPIRLEHICTHPSGITWAGALRNHLCLVTLQGSSGAA
jgi:WD40 repeat protein